MCLDDIDFADERLVRLPCDHFFHRSCVEQWLCRHSTCPLCRSTLTEPMKRLVLLAQVSRSRRLDRLKALKQKQRLQRQAHSSSCQGETQLGRGSQHSGALRTREGSTKDAAARDDGKFYARAERHRRRRDRRLRRNQQVASGIHADSPGPFQVASANVLHHGEPEPLGQVLTSSAIERPRLEVKDAPLSLERKRDFSAADSHAVDSIEDDSNDGSQTVSSGEETDDDSGLLEALQHLRHAARQEAEAARVEADQARRARLELLKTVAQLRAAAQR